MSSYAFSSSVLLELSRLWFSVPFSVGKEGYEEGTLTASSDSHDSLETNRDKEINKSQLWI